MEVDLLHQHRKKDWPALKGPAFCGICGSSAAKAVYLLGLSIGESISPASVCGWAGLCPCPALEVLPLRTVLAEDMLLRLRIR